MANARRSPTQYDGRYGSKLHADSSAVSGGQPSSGYASLADDLDPEFKDDVERWKCPKCGRKPMKNPVQTMCGHRYCEQCLVDFLPKDGSAVKCPANEEDCEMISKEGQSKHVDTCTYKRVSCPNSVNGCKEKLRPENVESHLKVCTFTPQPCEYCNKIGNHDASCLYRETECTFVQFGCTFEGNVPSLEKHHKAFMPQHLEMLTVYVANMDSENSLRSQLQAALSERDILSSKIRELVSENKNIKETQKNLQRNLAKHDDRLTKLDGQFSKVDSDISTQRRDLNLLQNTELLARAGDTGVAQRPVQESVEQLERQLGVFNLRMVEMDLRFQLLEASSYNGTLLWKITNYHKRKADAVAGKTLSLYSQPFYTDRHGYKMCGRVYLNGDGMGKGTHISLFFTVMKGDYDALLDWPFRQKVTFMILDQEAGRNNLVDSFRPDPNSSSFKRPTSEMNIASGCPLFAQQCDVEGANSRFVKDDTIFIKVIVDSQNIRHP